MNAYYNLLIKFFLFLIVYYYSVNTYSQNVEVVTRGDKKFVIEKNNLSVNKIVPVTGSSVFEESKPAPQNNPDNINSLNWVLKFSASGLVFRDVSFANSQVGYICSEAGYVFKTSNGGDNWVQVLGLSFPWYWYGVYALTSDTVILAGFLDPGRINSGIMRWTFNGGATWTNDISVTIPYSGAGWLSHVHFFNQNTGVVSNDQSGFFYYTTNGGKDSASWHYVQVNSDGGWFEGDFDADANGNIYTTGYHFARSTNYGMTWTSGQHVDGTFDGGVDFIDTNLLKGMTGGGQISSPVSGWIHRTTDGGQTWSSRLYSFPWPIRSVKYFSDSLMLAFGGDYFVNAGGVYSSTNAGANWNLDVSTGSEMFSYDYCLHLPDSMDIWTVGTNGSLVGVAYRARTGNLVGIKNTSNQIVHVFHLFQNYPNPFNPSTIINYQLPISSNVTITVYNILGERISELVNEQQNAGDYKITWDASKFPSGIYFYKLSAAGSTGNYSEVKKMLLIK